MYYILNHSLDLKIVGKFPQSENITNVDYENPDHIVNNYFKKIDYFEPIAPIPILLKKSKVTDLISNSNAGGLLHLLVSEKLKDIILKHRTEGLQFFKTHLIQNNQKIENYYSLNMWEDNMEYVDFSKSNVKVRTKKIGGGTEIKDLKLNDLEEFYEIVNHHKIKMEIVFIENINLNSIVNNCFFMLKNPVKFIVSEKLKQEIEDASCTGIEFQPIELSYNEWTAPGGEREKIYGKY